MLLGRRIAQTPPEWRRRIRNLLGGFRQHGGRSPGGGSGEIRASA